MFTNNNYYEWILKWGLYSYRLYRRLFTYFAECRQISHVFILLHCVEATCYYESLIIKSSRRRSWLVDPRSRNLIDHPWLKETGGSAASVSVPYSWIKLDSWDSRCFFMLLESVLGSTLFLISFKAQLAKWLRNSTRMSWRSVWRRCSGTSHRKRVRKGMRDMNLIFSLWN